MVELPNVRLKPRAWCKMASDKIEDLTPYIGLPTKFVGIGSVMHTEWRWDYDEEGNKIKGTDRKVEYYGWEVQLYTHQARKLDGKYILTKIGVIEQFSEVYDPMKPVKKRKTKISRKHAEHFARGVAEMYDWLYLGQISHNDPLGDSEQAFIELEELEHRGTVT